MTGLESTADTAHNYDADIIAIVEGSANGESDTQTWKQAFPGYSTSDLRSGMILLARGEVHDVDVYPLPGRGHAFITSVTLHDELIRLVVVDLDPNLFQSRHKSIRKLISLINDMPTPPDFILGDFNTPADSVAMDMLRGQYTNAFEEHGSGYVPTWPMPIPVLQLDHIWIGPRITGLKCEAGWTLQSDHRPLLLHATINHNQRTE